MPYQALVLLIPVLVLSYYFMQKSWKHLTPTGEANRSEVQRYGAFASREWFTNEGWRCHLIAFLIPAGWFIGALIYTVFRST